MWSYQDTEECRTGLLGKKSFAHMRHLNERKNNSAISELNLLYWDFIMTQ